MLSEAEAVCNIYVAGVWRGARLGLLVLLRGVLFSAPLLVALGEEFERMMLTFSNETAGGEKHPFSPS